MLLDPLFIATFCNVPPPLANIGFPDVVARNLASEQRQPLRRNGRAEPLSRDGRAWRKRTWVCGIVETHIAGVRIALLPEAPARGAGNARHRGALRKARLSRKKYA